MNADPDNTVVVILGASEFPQSSLDASEAFTFTAKAWRKYFLDDFEIPESNILDLFDSARSGHDQNLDVVQFLKQTSEASPSVIVLYVGHGGFTGNGTYWLALRSTMEGQERATSYEFENLANTLMTGARFLRKYLILDCCYAARATAYLLQSNPVDVALMKAKEALPPTVENGRGTSLLCASGPLDPARILPDGSFTMFSDALLSVLKEGIPDGPDWLSVSMVGNLTKERISHLHQVEGVRPQLHSPDQTEGDVASFALFPNSATKVVSPGRALAGLLEKVAWLEKSEREKEQRDQQLVATIETLRARLEQAEANGLGPTSSAIASGAPGSYIHGLTRLQWDSIPPPVKSEVNRYLQARIIGYGWVISSLLVSMTACIALAVIVSSYERISWLYFLNELMYAVVSIMMLVSLFCLVVSILTELTRPRPEAGHPPFQEADSIWSSADIVVLAKDFIYARAFPGAPIGFGSLTLGTLFYVLAFAVLFSRNSTFFWRN